MEIKEIKLPEERTKSPKFDSVNKLVITGHQGTGKTHLCATLPNSIVIDFEDGCKDHYQAKTMNLKKIASENNISLGQAYLKTIELIKAANKEAGKCVYDFIIFDGVTAIEKLSHQKATHMFKNSVVGKGMLAKGTLINDVVTDVPESGWLWLHKAFEELYSETIGLSRICNIYIAHAKQSSLMKQGVRLEASDMALTGKLKLTLLRDVDGSGMIYRDENQVKISFKTNERDLTTKSRARHLNEKEFIISEMIDDKLTTYWENIFPELKEEK